MPAFPSVDRNYAAEYSHGMNDEEYDEEDDGDFIDEVEERFGDDIDYEPTTDSLLDELSAEDGDDYMDHSEDFPPYSEASMEVDSAEAADTFDEETDADGEDSSPPER